MPSPLSVDLRERVVAAVAAGASCHRAAARFGVSVSSAGPLVGALPRRGASCAQADRQQSHLASHRGACRADPEDLQASGLASEKWRALSVMEEVSNGRTQEAVHT